MNDEQLVNLLDKFIDKVSAMSPREKKKLDYTVERAEIKKKRDELLETIEQLKVEAEQLAHEISELDREYMESLEKG